jgi:biotin carboxylase
VQDYEELKERFINKMPYNEDFLIENVKAGIEYGIDAAIINGVFYLILLREKILTPYPYRQCVGYYSIPEDENNSDLFKKINSFMTKVMKIMKLDNILLHADIIYDGNDVFLIEIGARPSGHNLHDLFTPIVTGIDMISEFIKFAVPQLQQAYIFTSKQMKCMLIRYFDFENCNVISIPDKNKLQDKYFLTDFKCNIYNGQFMEKIVDDHALMTRGYFIVEGNTRQELESVSRNILNEFVLKNA